MLGHVTQKTLREFIYIYIYFAQFSWWFLNCAIYAYFLWEHSCYQCLEPATFIKHGLLIPVNNKEEGVTKKWLNVKKSKNLSNNRSSPNLVYILSKQVQ